MPDLLTDTSQLTPEWLTDVLTGTPALASGRVERVEIVQNVNLSTSVGAAILRLQYAIGSEGRLPTRLFFKIGRRTSEVNFNKQIAGQLRAVHVPMCHFAEFSNVQGLSNLLFEDISETHSALPEGLPPPRQHIQRFAELLAPLHRQWWESPDLKPGGVLYPLREDLPDFVLRQAREQYPGFITFLGDRLSSKRRGWYERVFARLPLPAWQDRIRRHQGVTLVHGAPHSGNFAVPRLMSLPVYLLDWSLWHVNLPAYDLAYMIALQNYPERRHRLEKEILKGYFINLSLPSYSWSQFWDDYRMSVVFHTIWPVFFYRTIPNHIWYQMLEQVMSAFEDLACEEFL